MRKVFLTLEAKIFWQLSSFSLHNSDVLRSAARLLVMTSARGCREGRRAIAAFEGPFVGVLVHVLEQVPLVGKPLDGTQIWHWYGLRLSGVCTERMWSLK